MTDKQRTQLIAKLEDVIYSYNMAAYQANNGEIDNIITPLSVLTDVYATISIMIPTIVLEFDEIGIHHPVKSFIIDGVKYHV